MTEDEEGWDSMEGRDLGAGVSGSRVQGRGSWEPVVGGRGLLLPSQPRKEAPGLDWLVQWPWRSPALPSPPDGDLPSGSPGHPALDLGLDTRGGWHSAHSPGPPLRVGPCCKHTWAWCGLLGASRQRSALRSPHRPPLPPESLRALTSVSQEGGPGPARTAHTAKSVH